MVSNESRFGPVHRWRVLAIGVAANASFAVAVNQPSEQRPPKELRRLYVYL